MRAGGRILIIFGLLLAIIAGVATFLILRAAPAVVNEEEAAAAESVDVVMAVQPLNPWEEIPQDALTIRRYPAPAPEDAIGAEVTVVNEETQEQETISGIEYVRGKISNTQIYPGQVLVETQLIDKALEEQRRGLGSDASYIVPDGQVAIAIPINQLASVAGAVRAGDQVDLIATANVSDPTDPEAEPVPVVQFMLQRVQILRVGLWGVQEGGEEGSSFVTVIVDPQQAVEIKAIRELTNYEFVLRSITDESEFVTEPVDLDYLIEKYDVRPAQ